MPWEIPITLEDTTYPVRFNTEESPTQADIDEAVALILQQRATQQPEDTGQGRLSSAASNVGRGALSVIPGTIGGVGYLTGSDTLVGAAKDVEQGIEEMLPVNPAYQEELSQKAANVLGQAGGMLLTGGAAGAIGKGRALAKGLEAAAAAAKGTKAAQAASLGTGMLQGTYGGGQEAEKYGMTGGSAYARALLGGALEGATEKYLFGMGTELAPVRKFLGDTVESGIGSILKSAGTEAGEEVAAQIGGNVATTALAPTGVATPDALSGVGEAALLGGVAGGALGGVNNLMSGSQAPTVEGTLVEEAPEPIDPLVAQLEAAKKADVPVDDLVQSAQERFDVLQAKAADQTTPLTQEEVDEMDALTEAFADPANIDPAALADLYDVRIAQPVVDEVAPTINETPAAAVDIASQPSPNLVPLATENAPPAPVRQPGQNYREYKAQADEWFDKYGKTHNEDGTPKQPTVLDEAVALVFRDLKSASSEAKIEAIGVDTDLDVPATLRRLLNDGWVWDPQQKRMVDPQNRGETPVQALYRLRGSSVVAAAPAPAPNPIAQNAINAVNNPAANLPATAALLNADQGALNPTPTETQENAPTQERQVESPSGTPPVQGQPADQGANRQAPEGTAQREDQGAEVAPAPAGQGPQFSQGGQADTAQDAEYLAAVEAGDMTKAQRLVDEAASGKGLYLIESNGSINPNYLNPVNRVYKGREQHVANMAREFVRSGQWNGRPILVIGNNALTGSHRIFAARRANEILRRLGQDEIEIPTFELSNEQAKKFDDWIQEDGASETNALSYDSFNDSVGDDADKANTVKAAFKDEVIPLEFYALLKAEELSNWGNGFDKFKGQIYASENQIKSADPITYDDAGNIIPLSQRFNQASQDIRFSQGGQAGTQNQSPESLRHAELEAKFKAGTITPEETAEAEKLVAKRAKAVGATNRLQHWTNSDTFTRFDPAKIGAGQKFIGTQVKGFWFNDANGTRSPFGAKKIDAFLFLKNPKVFESAEAFDAATETFDSSEEFTSNLVSQGYDGVIIKPAEEWMGSQEWEFTNYVAFSPNQIKSAETFTGVPLDQRFDTKSEDIRFSQAPQTPTGLPAAKVKTVVDQVMAKNKSPLQVRVITQDELQNSPEFQDIRDALENQGADSQFTEAWVDDRTQTVVIVADSFSSAARIREVLVHEIIGHAGVDAFASEADISRVLKILDRRVPDLVNQVRARYPNLNEAGIAREVIAKFSEQYQSADFASLPSGMKALWRELKAWLGGIIQRLNVNIAAFDDLTLNWFYTNAVNAAAGITPLSAPTATTAAAPAAETAPVATEAAPAATETAAPAATETAAPAATETAAPAATETAAPAATETAAPEAAPAAKKKFVLPRARIRQKAAPAEAENAVGVANAVVDAARAKIGLPPVYAPARQSFGALWDQALRALSIDPKKGEKIVEDLNNKSREISALETAILTHELVTRTLEFDRATEALNNATESEKEDARKDYDRAITKLQEAWNASDVSGTEQGRSLNARKMLVALDYTLAKMVSMRTAAAERPLNPEQRAQTEELFAKIDALQKKLNELEKSGKPSGEEARLEDLLASAREEGKLEAQKEAKLLEEAAAILKAEEAARAAKIKKGADAAKVLEDSVDAARARLRARKGLFGAKTPEVVQEEAGDIQIKFSIADAGIVGLSAQDIADLTLVGKSYVAEGATTLESWSEKMIEEFGEEITDYLEPLYENSKAPVATAPAAKATKAPKEKTAPAEKAPKEKKLKASPMERIKAEAKEGKELSPKLVYELVKQKLQEGISGVDNVFKAITKDLQEEFPLMTEREIRDIFSGYGVPIHPSQEDLAKKIRELRRLSQLTSALEDAKAFILPLKSGKQRDAVSDAIRDLQKEITRVMQENNLVQATTSKQLKSTLDSLKTRLKNQIVDLNAQIKKKEKAPKKAGVVYDQEANDLRAERDRLQEILNGIVGPSQPSPTQRIRQRVNQLQKEITDLEKKVATRDITKRATQPVPETERIQVLKDQRDALREQLHVIRVEIEGDPSLTQEQINERAEKAIQRNIEDLERRIKEKDFSKKAGNQAAGPIVEQLRAQRDALREQYIALREAIQGKPQKTDQQRIDMADKALDKSIAELEEQIKSGKTDVKPKVAPIETPNLKAKRDQRDALKKVRDDMRRAVKVALADPVAKQLARDKKNIARQIEKLRTKIANRDFSKPTKIVHTTDLEKQNLEAKLNMLKSDWTKILFEEKLANRTTTQKLLGDVGQTFNLARAVLTSFDFSGVLRQGGFIVLGNPLRAIKNLRPMFAAFASKEAETKAKLALQKRPNFALYQRDKLFLADMDATPSMAKQEEAYASRWVDKIPWWMFGGLVRGSQRGYVTFLNNLRADSYDAMMLAFRKGPVATQEESKAIVDYINIATGRGDLGKFTQAAEGLNTVFFAPRLVASRFQLLLGMPYFSATGRTKNLILQEYAKFLTGVAVVYMLGMLAQEDEDKPIETDPRSTNFGKIRFGNSRVDPLSGLQQVTVLLARLVSGQTKTATGKIVDIRGENVPYGGATPVNIVAKFARSKLSPVFGSVTNMIQGENVIGEKVTPFGELERMVVPMSFGEIRKVMEEQGVPKGMVLSTLALFGMGVQTYDETKKR